MEIETCRNCGEEFTPNQCISNPKGWCASCLEHCMLSEDDEERNRLEDEWESLR